MKKTTEEITEAPAVNAGRRRLTKAGLAAPVVLGTLASRQVLGQTEYWCTPSGQTSGNVSSHGEQVSCASLGISPSKLAGEIGTTAIKSRMAVAKSDGHARKFKDVLPNSALFTDAFERYDTNNGDRKEDVTTFDLLKGYPVDNDGKPKDKRGLRVRAGYDQIYGLELGKEALAACQSAVSNIDYPLRPADVVAMFNAVITGGNALVASTYTLGNGKGWGAQQVLDYLKTLHP